MALTQNLTQSCSAGKAAGIQTLYLIDKDDFTSATLASGSTSDYDTITLTSAKHFWTFEFEQDQAEFSESVEVERDSVKVTHSIEIFLPGVNASNRNAIQEIISSTPCGMIAVVKDNNGVNWLVGYTESQGKNRPVKLLTDETTTAKALGEANGSTVTLQSIDTTKAYTTSAVIVTS